MNENLKMALGPYSYLRTENTKYNLMIYCAIFIGLFYLKKLCKALIRLLEILVPKL